MRRWEVTLCLAAIARGTAQASPTDQRMQDAAGMNSYAIFTLLVSYWSASMAVSSFLCNLWQLASCLHAAMAVVRDILPQVWAKEGANPECFPLVSPFFQQLSATATLRWPISTYLS